MEQAKIDQLNAAFWDEPCGTHLAKVLGIKELDQEGLARFDREFFDMYPYVDRFIKFDELAGKKVLEIGLGFGSVSERLARFATDFTGLDIAQGPADLVNYRMQSNGLSGRAQVGSALAMPFQDDTFDFVVSIGCLHHTGDMRRGIAEIHRVLKPGGKAVLMVYNALSYMRWLTFTRESIGYVRAGFASSDEPLALIEKQRAAYDSNSAGQEAPETVMASKTTFANMLRAFSDVKVERANANFHVFRGKYISRKFLLWLMGPKLGLDLYATVVK
jgi:ubiquinone/menaquinone biosynthesis C-methylase UbiE